MTDSKNLVKFRKKSRDALVGDSKFAITVLTKDSIPKLPFFVMKEKVLGKRYALSLVFASDSVSENLNQKYRNKEYTPNALSFPLDIRSGEIFINLRQARREYRARKESFDYYVSLLFIHSMLHLKGYRHGSTMDNEEKRLLSGFKIKNIF